MEIYNIFDTGAILNRPATVAVDSHSGLAGIAHWMNGYFRLHGDDVVTKQDPVVALVRAEVDREYAVGRNTVMGDDELVAILRRVDKKRFKELAYLAGGPKANK